MNGKGDKRRPQKVPQNEYESNWDRIFSNPNLEERRHELDTAIHEKKKNDNYRHIRYEQDKRPIYIRI